MAKKKGEASSSGKEFVARGRGRPSTTTEPTVTMSIRITEARKQRLKVYAAINRTTISRMVAELADGLEL